MRQQTTLAANHGIVVGMGCPININFIFFRDSNRVLSYHTFHLLEHPLARYPVITNCRNRSGTQYGGAARFTASNDSIEGP